MTLINQMAEALKIAHQSLQGQECFLSQPEWEKIENAIKSYDTESKNKIDNDAHLKDYEKLIAFLSTDLANYKWDEGLSSIDRIISFLKSKEILINELGKEVSELKVSLSLESGGVHHFLKENKALKIRINELEEGIKNTLNWIEINRPTIAGTGAIRAMFKELLNP